MKMHIKNIFILFLIVINAFTVTSKVRRSRGSRRSRRFKDSGSGTWETGYTSPALFLDGAPFSEAIFYPHDIKSDPNQEAGIIFDLQNIKDKKLIAPFLFPVNAQTEKHTLPYRFITSKFALIDEGTLKPRNLEVVIQNDQGLSKKFKIELPFKAVGNFVSRLQVGSLISLIQEKRTAYCKKFNAAKENFKLSYDAYVKTKGNYYNDPKPETLDFEIMAFNKDELLDLYKKLKKLEDDFTNSIAYGKNDSFHKQIVNMYEKDIANLKKQYLTLKSTTRQKQQRLAQSEVIERFTKEIEIMEHLIPERKAWIEQFKNSFIKNYHDRDVLSAAQKFDAFVSTLVCH